MSDGEDDSCDVQALGDERCRDGAASMGDVLVKMSIAMFGPPFSRLVLPQVLPKLSEPLKTMLAIHHSAALIAWVGARWKAS